MEVSFERDGLDLERQVNLPARLRLDGAELPIVSWSLREVVSTYEGPLLEPGTIKRAELVLPFPSFECGLKLDLRFTRYSQRNLAHFDVIEIPASARKMIREYAESFIEGYEEAPILLVDPSQAGKKYDLVPALSKGDVRKNDRKMFRRLAFYGLFLCILGAVAWFAWREITYVQALHGSVEGNLVLYRSPDNGPISRIHVKDGEEVGPGQLLYEISDRFYGARLGQLQEVRLKVDAAIREIHASLENEEENTRLYTQAARSRRALLKEELEQLRAQLEYSVKRAERAEKLLARQAIPIEEHEQIKSSNAALSAQVRHKEQELVFQETVVEEAGKNRFFSGSEIQGRLHALRQELAAQEVQRERLVDEVLQVKNLIERCKVRSTVAGKIHHLSRMEGDHVREGDYVLTVAARHGGPPCIVARLLAEDSQYLRLGQECEVVFVSRGGTGRGRVVAIGHSGLNSKGVVSVDQETAGAGVPIKIELLQGPADIQAGEGVFIKLPRNWSLHGFLKKLS